MKRSEVLQLAQSRASAQAFRRLRDEVRPGATMLQVPAPVVHNHVDVAQPVNEFTANTDMTPVADAVERLHGPFLAAVGQLADAVSAMRQESQQREELHRQEMAQRDDEARESRELLRQLLVELSNRPEPPAPEVHYHAPEPTTPAEYQEPAAPPRLREFRILHDDGTESTVREVA